MTGKTFLNRVANGQTDTVALLLSLLQQTGARYCVRSGRQRLGGTCGQS